MKKILKISLFLFLILWTASLFAFEIRTGSKIVQTYDIDGDYAILAGDIHMNSNVRGNLYLLGGTVDFKGRVDNDLYIAGGECILDGVVEDNAYVAGGNIRVSGRFYNDVNLAGGRILLDSLSFIRGDLNVAGDEVKIDGKIFGNVEVHANTLLLNGTIDGNVVTYVDEIRISNMSTITGFLDEREAEDRKYKWTKHHPRHFRFPGFRRSGTGLNFFLFSLLCAAIWYYIFPLSFKGSGKLVEKDPVKMGLWGLLWLVVLPLAGVLSMIFIVSIPFSILFLLFVSITLFLGQFPISVWLGEIISHRIPGFNKGMLPAATGLFILHVILKVPVLGIIALILWFLSGFGSIWYWILKRRHAVSVTNPEPPVI
jgi:cytoskeletal protein CcmA (bactofilin family)